MNYLVEYAPTVLIPFVITLITIWDANRRAAKANKTDNISAQISGEAKFRADLLKEIDVLRLRLFQCEKQCSQCKQEHAEANRTLIEYEREITELQDRVRALENDNGKKL